MISIIIPTSRYRSFIKEILAFLNEEASYLDERIEVIIVKDGIDNRLEWENLSFNNFTLHVFYQNHEGPAAARNLGIRKAKGDIICFLDDDSLPQKNWLYEITLPFYQGNADIVSGKIISYNQTKNLPYLLEKSVYKPQKRFATSNIAYRRKVFDKIGLFDTRFRLASWEDNDLGVRARLAGFRHIYNPQAVVKHQHEESLEEFKEKALRNGRGLAIFLKKYFSLPYVSLFFLYLTLRYLLLSPFLIFSRKITTVYLKFFWSWYSLKGIFKEWFKI